MWLIIKKTSFVDAKIRCKIFGCIYEIINQFLNTSVNLFKRL